MNRRRFFLKLGALFVAAPALPSIAKAILTPNDPDWRPVLFWIQSRRISAYYSPEYRAFMAQSLSRCKINRPSPEELQAIFFPKP